MHHGRAKAYITAGLFTFLIILASHVIGKEIEVKREGPRIDSVIIDNHNIYDTDTIGYDLWMFKLANRLHIKTRKYVIERELLLKTGDQFSNELAEETERNLRALPFIWDARVKLINLPSGRHALRVRTSDKWTFVGGPALSRSSGNNVLELRLVESNFLGRGQFVSAKYYIREHKENFGEFAFTERRVFGSRILFSALTNTDPDFGHKNIGIQKPFYAQTSQFLYGISYNAVDHRNKYYTHSTVAAQDKIRGRSVQLQTSYRFGTYDQKVQFGLNYGYSDNHFFDRAIFDTVFNEGEFPVDSIIHSVTPSIAITGTKFIKTTRINTFNRPEDIALINGAELDFGWNYDPRVGRELYRSLLFSYLYSAKWQSNYLFLTLSRSFSFKNSFYFRKGLDFSIKYYNNSSSWATSVIYLLFQEDQRIDRINSLFLGENSGVRGYPENYDSGEKLIRGNFEVRYFAGISLFSVDFGAAQFVDLAQVRRQGESFDLNDLVWAVGAGLRIGTEKISEAGVLRIDLAYAGRIKKWLLSFSLGQYIQ